MADEIIKMTDENACRGCGHPKAEHYRARDPDYESLKSVYCGQDGCMCWERFAIARDNPGPLTPARKPKTPGQVGYEAMRELIRANKDRPGYSPEVTEMERALGEWSAQCDKLKADWEHVAAAILAKCSP